MRLLSCRARKGVVGRGGGRLASEQRRSDESVTQRTTRRKKMEVIRVSESTEKFGGFFLKKKLYCLIGNEKDKSMHFP